MNARWYPVVGGIGFAIPIGLWLVAVFGCEVGTALGAPLWFTLWLLSASGVCFALLAIAVNDNPSWTEVGQRLVRSRGAVTLPPAYVVREGRRHD